MRRCTLFLIYPPAPMIPVKDQHMKATACLTFDMPHKLNRMLRAASKRSDGSVAMAFTSHAIYGEFLDLRVSWSGLVLDVLRESGLIETDAGVAAAYGALVVGPDRNAAVALYLQGSETSR